MDDKLIRFYTELIFVSHPPEKADVILVPGSDTEALGQKAAQLWKEGLLVMVMNLIVKSIVNRTRNL